MIAKLGITVILTICAAPKGQNLQDAEFWAESSKKVVAKGKRVNAACGTNIKTAYDDKSYEKVSYDDARAETACKHSLDALATVCRTDLGKDAVRNKVKHVRCQYSTSGTRIEVKNGAMIVHLDPNKTFIKGDKPGSYSWMSAIKERL